MLELLEFILIVTLIVLVILKLNDLIDLSWWMILSPLIIELIMVIVVNIWSIFNDNEGSKRIPRKGEKKFKIRED